MSKSQDKYKYKITVIGDGRVGKTSLIQKFTKGSFQKDYIKTIGAQFSNYKQNIESLNLIFEEFSSTTEIIYKMMRIYDINISLPFKYLIISAILTDSGFLRHSSTNTIRNIVQILGDTIEIQDIYMLFNNSNEIPERIARIKGLQRVKLIRFNL